MFKKSLVPIFHLLFFALMIIYFANPVYAADNAVTDVSVLDSDSDGTIDRIQLTVDNDSLNAAASHDTSGWTVTDDGNDVTVNAVSISGLPNADPLIIHVDLDTGDGDLDTDDTSTNTIEVTYVQQGADAGFEFNDLLDTQLQAIAVGDTDATNTENDAAPPVQLNQTYNDTNSDGVVETVNLIMSETIATNTAQDSDFVWVASDLVGSTIDSYGLQTGTNILTVTLTGAPADTTSTIVDPTISYTDDVGREISDADGNQLATYLAKTVNDAAKAVALSAITQDTDENGKVDHLEVTFSEAIDDSAINAYSAGTNYTPASLAVANVTGEAVDATEGTCPNDAAEDDEYLCIIFDEDPLACDADDQSGCDTAAIDQDLTWTGASITITDFGGQQADNLASLDIVEADGSAPIVVGLTLLDQDSDGIADRLSTLWSEALQDTATGANGWSITGNDHDSGGDCGAETADPDGTTAYNVDFTCDTAYTQVGDMTATFTQNAGILDAAGNQSPATVFTSGSTPAILDGIGALLTSWTVDFTAKTLTTNWSEDVDASTLDATKVTVQDAATATNSYSLTAGTTASADGTQIVVDLSDADNSAIRADANIATTTANAFLSLATGLIDDLIANANLIIADGSALQATTVTGGAPIGALTPSSASLSTTQLGANSTVSVSMTLTTALPDDGKIKITFPAGFKLAGVSGVGNLSNVDGTFAIGISGQEVSLTRQADGSLVTATTAIGFDLSLIGNPSVTGTTANFIFQTTDATDFVLDQNSAVPGVTITGISAPAGNDNTAGSGGGGGGGGGQTADNASNTESKAAVAEIETVDGEQSYSSVIELENLIVDQDNAEASGQLTTDGTVLLKPNLHSSISAFFPPNTMVTGPANWNGRIHPPVLQSLSLIDPEGNEIEGSNGMLMAKDVTAIVKVGSAVPLSFSKNVTLAIPLDLPDGTKVKVYISKNGDTWVHFTESVVKNGMISFTTDHFSYFAMVAGDEASTPVILAANTSEPAPSEVVDLNSNEYIRQIKELGIIDDASQYPADQKVTRAEMTTMSLRAFGIDMDLSLASKPFIDVPLAEWFSPYVQAAKQKGIVEGVGNGYFEPNRNVNRAEALKILLKSAGVAEDDVPSMNLPDVSDADWFSRYAYFGFANDLIKLYKDGTFRPSASMTRAEAAGVILESLNLK